MVIDFLVKFRRPLIYLIVALVHLVLLLYLKIGVNLERQENAPLAQVMKLVDVEEYIPPPPEPEEQLEVSDQPEASEEIVEVEQEVIESDMGIPTDQVMVNQEPDYLPQHKITYVPEIPNEFLERVVYPPIALRQGLEAVVYVELFIDRNGSIRRVEILRDPGNGFAEAAIEALKGLQCIPAKDNNHNAIAVRYRYPIRFTLN